MGALAWEWEWDACVEARLLVGWEGDDAACLPVPVVAEVWEGVDFWEDFCLLLCVWGDADTAATLDWYSCWWRWWEAFERFLLDFWEACAAGGWLADRAGRAGDLVACEVPAVVFVDFWDAVAPPLFSLFGGFDLVSLRRGVNTLSDTATGGRAAGYEQKKRQRHTNKGEPQKSLPLNE